LIVIIKDVHIIILISILQLHMIFQHRSTPAVSGDFPVADASIAIAAAWTALLWWKLTNFEGVFHTWFKMI
jgi:hypothetical protein